MVGVGRKLLSGRKNKGETPNSLAAGGGTQKSDAVRKLSKGGCVKKQTRGGG